MLTMSILPKYTLFSCDLSTKHRVVGDGCHARPVPNRRVKGAFMMSRGKH
jgi:hypothetical protein